DQLVTGLGARFGEHELTSEVNALRLQHLKSSNDKVYAESTFKISPGIGHAWNVASMPGLGAGNIGVVVGFNANADLESDVITAFGDDIKGSLDAPLQAIAAARGFILPESMDHIKSMKPG